MTWVWRLILFICGLNIMMKMSSCFWFLIKELIVNYCSHFCVLHCKTNIAAYNTSMHVNTHSPGAAASSPAVWDHLHRITTEFSFSAHGPLGDRFDNIKSGRGVKAQMTRRYMCFCTCMSESVCLCACLSVFVGPLSCLCEIYCVGVFGEGEYQYVTGLFFSHRCYLCFPTSITPPSALDGLNQQ